MRMWVGAGALATSLSTVAISREVEKTLLAWVKNTADKKFVQRGVLIEGD